MEDSTEIWKDLGSLAFSVASQFNFWKDFWTIRCRILSNTLEATKNCKHQKCPKDCYSDRKTVQPIIFTGDPQLGETELYEQALGHLETSGIPCRMLRTDFVGVKSDAEYLAKLHCLRLGFKRIMENTEHRGW